MRSADCRKYVEQCLQLARELAPEHRKLVLELADKWLQAAEELRVHEDQSNGTGERETRSM
ncbi:MAG TPA: hypothetical protein VIY51_15160 [Xanthobacteraceae bacterium]